MYGKTTNKELSRMYFVACSGIHDVVDQLYEALHVASDGSPKLNEEHVNELGSRSKKAIFLELDLIKTALAEFNEINADKQ